MNKKLKIMITLILTIIMTCASIPISNARADTEKSEFIVGDIDEDGAITINDAYKSLLYYARLEAGEKIEPVDTKRYDVNDDGKIDLEDSFEILLYYSKLEAGSEEIDWPPLSSKPVTTTSTQETAVTTSVSPNNDNLDINVNDTLMYIGSGFWNVRSTPKVDLSNNIVAQIKQGETFIVTAIYDKEWLEVTFKGFNHLYIMISNQKCFKKISEDPITTDVTKATISTTNISTTTTSTTTTVTKTTDITKKETTTTTQNTVTTTTQNVSEVKYTMGDTVKFTGKSWNCRDSIKGSIIDKLGKDETVLIIRNVQDSWYEVYLNEKICYIDMTEYWYFYKVKEVEKEQKISNGVSVGKILKFKYVSWNIYASSDFQKSIGVIKSNQLIAILEKNGYNLKIVTDDGKIGVIHCENVGKYFVEMV